jgi:hypothetical protein
MKFRTPFAFGALAAAATIVAADSHAILSAIFLLAALPLWLLFIIFLVRDLRP